jgi:hypothetical protein
MNANMPTWANQSLRKKAKITNKANTLKVSNPSVGSMSEFFKKVKRLSGGIGRRYEPYRVLRSYRR